jgi:hypothetical protein
MNIGIPVARFHPGNTGEYVQRALELLLRTEGLRVGFLGQGAAWKEEAAALLRKCLIGFNINTFFGQPSPTT